MSKSNAYETDLLGLLFNGTAIANIADNAASAPLTDLFVALHTADPGEAGNQGTNEANYTGYNRVTVAIWSGVGRERRYGQPSGGHRFSSGHGWNQHDHPFLNRCGE